MPLVITRDKDLPPTQTPATQAELADDDVDVEAMVARTRQRRSPRVRRMSARARQFAAMRDLSPSPSNEESVDKSMWFLFLNWKTNKKINLIKYCRKINSSKTKKSRRNK